MSRLTTLAAAAAVALVAVSASSAASGLSLRAGFVPQRVLQGKQATITVRVSPPQARCVLAVRYVDGSLQAGLGTMRAKAGQATWSWHLADDAPAGPARATVSCGRSGRLVRTFTVVGGTVRHSKLVVVQQGYSQKPASFGSGSSISYGIVLANPSHVEQAQKVSVLVNFLDANDHVMQTATTNVASIDAGARFYLGASSSLPSQVPVARLEVVVQTGGYAKATVHQPALDNVHILPGTFDKTTVGEIDGELINDHPTDTLKGAQLSIVLYDSAGNIVGGGGGSVFTSLPPGTRSYFSARSGFSAVPIDKASTVQVSIVPSYQAPAS